MPRVDGRSGAARKESWAIDCLGVMLRPILRFAVAHSIKLQDVVEAMKMLFLEVAEDEVRRDGGEVSMSKLSVMTGVHRRDCARFTKPEFVPKERADVTRRVLGQWQHDARFCTAGGKARVLTVEGKNSEFVELVNAVSQDLNPYTVLFELERVGAIERSKNGVKLRSGSYIPQGDIRSGYELLSGDMTDLISSVRENIEDKPATPHLHLKTQYDNIPADAIPEIQRWMIDEGSLFHQRARQFLARFDQDISGARTMPRGERFRVALASFSRTEKLKDKDKGI